ncbi:MAG TPA: hypothetical protein QF720_04920 [Nitrospinota bacterium]|jgi:hypothetical protein|nr:hypothetical protein [Nitrospinota bacterium]|tara:strand:- start:176487 stop:176708 length:222 start_codon:yes stop_codon:yes gene_type:complete
MGEEGTSFDKDSAALIIGKDMKLHIKLPDLPTDGAIPENVFTVMALASAYDSRPDLVEPIFKWFIKETEEFDE